MYLTVKEAIDLSGKSQTTIHRLCQKHDDSKYIKKEGNKYLIDKDFLLQQYPADEEINLLESKDLINSDKEQELIQSLTEKNLKITELSVENKELKEKVEQLQEDVFDLEQELAETMDANIGLHKEKEALSGIDEIAESVISEENSSEDEKNLIIYRAVVITASLMILTAFIAFMYYFTK